MKNFDRPYFSKSISEFWRRWHITLSRFLRDYLYIPLGGSRGGTLNTYRNLMLTMIIGGLWHGAAWKFVIWGALHGGMLAVEEGAFKPAKEFVQEVKKLQLDTPIKEDGAEEMMNVR